MQTLSHSVSINSLVYFRYFHYFHYADEAGSLFRIFLKIFNSLQMTDNLSSVVSLMFCLLYNFCSEIKLNMYHT